MKKYLAIADVTIRSGGNDSIVNGLIWLAVFAVIIWIAWLAINYFAPPEPFAKIIKVILGLFAFIVLIRFLISATGFQF